MSRPRPGVVKLKRGGGTGGHNGLTDIGRRSTQVSGACASASAIPATGPRPRLRAPSRRVEQDAIDPRSSAASVSAAEAQPDAAGCDGWLHTHQDEAKRRRRSTPEDRCPRGRDPIRKKNHESPMRHRRPAQRRQVDPVQRPSPRPASRPRTIFCTIEPNVGIVEVPDPRLKLLAAIDKPPGDPRSWVRRHRGPGRSASRARARQFPRQHPRNTRSPTWCAASRTAT